MDHCKVHLLESIKDQLRKNGVKVVTPPYTEPPKALWSGVQFFMLILFLKKLGLNS